LQWRAAEAARLAAASGDPTSPWHRVDGWRLNGRGRDVLRFGLGGETVSVALDYRADGYWLDLPGGTLVARGDIVRRDGDALDLRADLDGTILAATAVRHGREITVFAEGETRSFTLLDLAGTEDDDTAAPPHLAA